MLDNEENKCRHGILEMMSRFPTVSNANTDALKQYVLEMLSISLKVLFFF